MMHNIAVIGSGNTFFKDEGMGLYAAKYLKENFTFEPSVEIVDGGTLGFRLMPLLQEFSHVIIANTASDDTRSAGSIVVKSCYELLEGVRIKKTANEVEIAEMLQICSLLDTMAEVVIISIVPEDIISVEVALSTTLRHAWQQYIDIILAQIKALGVVITPMESNMDIDTILDIFSNPSIADSKGF